MSSPLDPSEVEALMQAIQDGRVTPESGSNARGPVMPYDLTSQDRIIRGQMPTLDTINDRIASAFGRLVAARTRLDVRVASTPATLLKFADVQSLLAQAATVGVLTLGPGHGMALLILEGELGQALLAGALGDRKARPQTQYGEGGRPELTNVEKLVLRHLLTMLTDAIAQAWAEVLPFKPEILRFESDPRLTLIASPSDVTVMCPFELAGALEGRLQIVIPYASVEPAKKQLSSPPRLGGPQGDARFSRALERELDEVKVDVCVEIGRRTLRLSELMALELGAVLTLSTSETAPLPVYVQGRQKMMAAPRVISGGLAAEVLQSVELWAKAEAARSRRTTPPSGGPTATPSPPNSRVRAA